MWGQVVWDVVYADDDTPVNPSPSQSNRALNAIALEGAYNGFKYRTGKC